MRAGAAHTHGFNICIALAAVAAADSEPMTRFSPAACRRPLTFLLLAGGLCGAVQAQYKCVDKRGAVSFQQLPCSNEERSQTLEVRPTNVAVPAVTPGRSSSTQQAGGSSTADRKSVV